MIKAPTQVFGIVWVDWKIKIKQAEAEVVPSSGSVKVKLR